MSHLETELFCIHCGRDTPHTVHYVGQQISRISCGECGQTLALDPERMLEHYASEFVHRLLTKPARMTEELRRDLSRFLISLPVRVVTKPVRVARELRDTYGELQALRKK